MYLVRCADHSLYAGVTTDCVRRENEHNGRGSGGAKYTQARRPVQLVWYEKCVDRSAACKREAVIKKLPRPKKLLLLQTVTG